MGISHVHGHFNMVQATYKHCFLRANPVFLACITAVTSIFSHFSGKQRHKCKASKEHQTNVTGEGESDTPRWLSACLHSPEKRKKTMPVLQARYF